MYARLKRKHTYTQFYTHHYSGWIVDKKNGNGIWKGCCYVRAASKNECEVEFRLRCWSPKTLLLSYLLLRFLVCVSLQFETKPDVGRSKSMPCEERYAVISVCVYCMSRITRSIAEMETTADTRTQFSIHAEYTHNVIEMHTHLNAWAIYTHQRTHLHSSETTCTHTGQSLMPDAARGNTHILPLLAKARQFIFCFVSHFIALPLLCPVSLSH